VQIQILLLLRTLQRELGMAMIFVTHDLGVAAEVSHRVAVMYAGRFVETGHVSDVVKRPSHPYTQGLLGSTVHGVAKGTKLATIPGAPPNLARLPEGCSFAPRCGYAEQACRVVVPAQVEEAGTSGIPHLTRCVRVQPTALACATTPRTA
jgi:peptide/nickel transport system ATP-binding protein